MAIEVTEDPYKLTASLRDPWRAYREFIVTGTDDPEDALTASGVPQADDEWVPGSSIKCTGPEIKSRDGVEYWRIGCEYIIPNAGSVTLVNPNPLLQKSKVNWGVMRQSTNVDIDLDGRCIADAAGNPITGVVRDISGFSFNVVRNEPFFDIKKSHAYSLCVNDRDVLIDKVVFRKWRLLLDHIIPIGEYQFGAPYITMGYQFHYLPADVLGDHPWQHRLLNAGDEGWYASASAKCKGKFCNDDGGVISGVRLDLSGIPIVFPGTSTKVGGGDGTKNAAISNPMPGSMLMYSNNTPIDAFEELRDHGKLVGYALLYKKVQIKDLTPILFS